MLARGYDTLLELVPDMLRQKSTALWGELDSGPPGTTSVFMWGWSAGAGRICGTAFRSGSGFEPEAMPLRRPSTARPFAAGSPSGKTDS
ncbi:hypothetical protein D3C77_490540 [compost metagenome]